MNDPTQIDAAIATVAQLLRTAATGPTRFPPTELFSEGWMLRLLMDAHQRGLGGLPIRHMSTSTWYSEGRLESAFRPRFRGDERGEGYTHADGVIGEFRFAESTTAGLRPAPGCQQFAVLEAKMGSKLSAGTTRARAYNQAARNVAALAWTLHEHGQAGAGLPESLAFLVIAPASRLRSEPTFSQYTDRESLRATIAHRIQAYEVDGDSRFEELLRFSETTLDAVLESATVECCAREDLIASTARECQASLRAFYSECLAHNRVG